MRVAAVRTWKRVFARSGPVSILEELWKKDNYLFAMTMQEYVWRLKMIFTFYNELIMSMLRIIKL